MLVNTSEAAALAGVSAALVRQWKRRGLLRQAGRWGRHPLYDPLEVLRVERSTRTGLPEHMEGVPGSHPVGWVYYAKRGDLVKIGQTIRLQQRVNILQARLLFAEIGGLDLERQRHSEFRAWRFQGEWFRATPELLRQLDELMAPVSHSPVTQCARAGLLTAGRRLRKLPGLAAPNGCSTR